MDKSTEDWRSKSFPKAGQGVNQTGLPETRGREVVDNAIATTASHVQGMRDMQPAQGGYSRSMPAQHHIPPGPRAQQRRCDL